MKRLVSIVLLLAMVFSLASCSLLLPGFGNVINSETGTNTDENSETNTETSTTTNTNTSTYVPTILDHDTINYVAKYADAKQTKIKYGNYSVKVPIVTDYYNNYEAALSMTFDDGASIGAANLAHEIMSQYGFKGTLFVNIGNIQGNVSQWQELVSKGTLDIGSHGWSHLAPSTITSEQMQHEIKDSYDYLWQYFPEAVPVTYATPLSQLTSAYKEYLKETGFIANRLETSGVMINPDTENPDFYTVYAKRIDIANDEKIVRINVSDALNTGKWFVELYHNVRTQDSTDIPEEDFRNHCQWLYDNYNGKVWFASYDDVVKYMVQRESTTIEYVDCDSESMTFVAKVDKNYGQEMTLKFYLPFFIDSAYAIVNGETQYLTLEKEPNTRVVYVNTEISETGTEIKIVLGGNDKYFNNCQHNYVESEVIAPTEYSYGYTVMVCTNELCQHSYKAKYTEYGSEDVTPSNVSFNGEELSGPQLTPYYNNYNAAISFTVDDGYDGNTATNIAEVMEKYGMRCTAMLNPVFLTSTETVNKWKKAFDGGYL